MKIKIPHIQLRLTLKEVHLLEFIFVLVVFVVFVRFGVFRFVLNIMEYILHVVESLIFRLLSCLEEFMIRLFHYFK
ncbi:MAG: hypothetical protein A2Y40_10810 [Candidatus Margulisbacteria bacterium GWF2_35_9]|nr:MAG: hypothetical protein A2Y40_10810 [Candidatus Margulisbacteria bacterium GWF2_35_9]